ncbi:MAG: IclR family transcriptional regulator C-terminal domain-containing protein, partial [Polaromonas sp.]
VMALTTATGMVFGAYLPAEKMQRFVEQSMHPQAFAQVVGALRSWPEMQPDLQEVRLRGMARVIGQPIPGVSAFAVPVFDHNGQVALVLTVIGPTGGFDPDWQGENARILKDVAGGISARLGFSEPNP